MTTQYARVVRLVGWRLTAWSPPAVAVVPLRRSRRVQCCSDGGASCGVGASSGLLRDQQSSWSGRPARVNPNGRMMNRRPRHGFLWQRFIRPFHESSLAVAAGGKDALHFAFNARNARPSRARLHLAGSARAAGHQPR